MLTGACSSNSGKSSPSPVDSGTGATCSAPGGPVTGPADTHCQESDGGMITQVTGTCVTDSSSNAPPADAGVLGGDRYGPTNFNSVAFDDDCKYHVSWTSTDICENANVTFTVTATKTVGGAALTGAGPYLRGVQDRVGQLRPLPADDDSNADGEGRGDLRHRPSPVRRIRTVADSVPLQRRLQRRSTGLAARPRGLLRQRAVKFVASPAAS